MTIEQFLHQRWADNEQLAALVPPGDVLTGPSRRDRPVCVTIHRPLERPLLTTNSAESLRELHVVFTVRHPHYESALDLADAIAAVFHGSAFALDQQRRVLSMRLGEQSVHHDDEHWQVAQTYRLVISTMIGA